LTHHCGLGNISLSPQKEIVLKVIFLEDVARVAKVGQTKEVANGYARNYLFPRKLAVLANSSTAAALDTHLKKLVKQRAIEEAEMTELAGKIQGVEITLKAKVGEKDKLYGSVTPADIVEELSKAVDREIDRKRIDLAEPIRHIGVYDVTVRLTHEITASIIVTVMSDAEGATAPTRAPKEEAPAGAKKEKKLKKEKAPKEKAVAEKIEEPAEAKTEKPSKEDKPAKEKKAKAEAVVEEEKPEKPAPEAKKEEKSEPEKTTPEAKKEKKTKAKSKKKEKTEEK
jgi:large subunit ribosomal protein L9